MAKLPPPYNETCHARSPLLNPLPLAGEDAKESRREIDIKCPEFEQRTMIKTTF